MSEIIRIKNAEYGEYEELLLERDRIRKEAYQYKLAYMAELGDLITQVFTMKLECIKKKKMIALCQLAVNQGRKINMNEMEIAITSEMELYYEQLRDMIIENDVAHSGNAISPGTLAQVKKLYHKLAKMIHPDINPRTNENEGLKTLWNMVVMSYNANDLEGLEEAEILINRALSDMGLEENEIEIPNICEKIKALKEEILEIKSNNPYQYKYLLENREAVREKKEALENELKEYENYSKELDNILDELLGAGGVSILWEMN